MSRRDRNGNLPLIELSVWIAQGGGREGWGIEVYAEGETEHELAAAIDRAFAKLRAQVREVLER